ncbi:hypothetical protein ASG17_01845 [Brevundimonas sp. Leaf363]|uniref:hypothetical protein n=1 Tax=Brevundimonas sp. Leaf363 TaxID=1736353 RepID=UPI0006F29B0F|nr:hypothetical protein [Brevundimonas sp. Leaf363]KQS57485.1 hypothetical protein ASG17_01845 [Brevundimonas sp. Leaf363]
MSFTNNLVTQKTATRFDPSATVFDKVQVPLFDLFRANLEKGGGTVLKGRTFKGCILEGPAVVLVLLGTRFLRTNFNSPGDIREILFAPVSPTKAIGAIPMADCVFEDCTFVATGFTGHQNFIDLMINELGGPKGNA